MGSVFPSGRGAQYQTSVSYYLAAHEPHQPSQQPHNPSATHALKRCQPPYAISAPRNLTYLFRSSRPWANNDSAHKLRTQRHPASRCMNDLGCFATHQWIPLPAFAASCACYAPTSHGERALSESKPGKWQPHSSLFSAARTHLSKGRATHSLNALITHRQRGNTPTRDLTRLAAPALTGNPPIPTISQHTNETLPNHHLKTPRQRGA